MAYFKNPNDPDVCWHRDLIEKFKKDFAKFFEDDEHICPDVMLKWLKKNI